MNQRFRFPSGIRAATDADKEGHSLYVGALATWEPSRSEVVTEGTTVFAKTEARALVVLASSHSEAESKRMEIYRERYPDKYLCKGISPMAEIDPRLIVALLVANKKLMNYVLGELKNLGRLQ